MTRSVKIIVAAIVGLAGGYLVGSIGGQLLASFAGANKFEVVQVVLNDAALALERWT